MLSRIVIFYFIIGLITCALSDLNIQSLKTQEFQTCKFLCEQHGEQSNLYCMYTLSTKTSSIIKQAIQRCNRIIEGMVNECIREECQQNNQNSPQIFKDFINSN